MTNSKVYDTLTNIIHYFLENLVEMFPRYYIDSDVMNRFKSSKN